MAFANASGVAAEVAVFISYLYATGTLGTNNPAVRLARKIDHMLYEVPVNMLSGFTFAVKDKETKTKHKKTK